MKKSNLHTFYIYKRIATKVDGESTITWKYKNKYLLNDQQDINELDKTTSGIIDFDTLKLRTNKQYDISKTDGISRVELEIDTNDMVINDLKPQYTVESINIIGKSHLYTCKTYNGE